MKFNLDQGYLAYDRVGSGTPLLLIHGYPLSRKIWKSQLSGLANIATIFSIDQRGHGESFSFEPPYSMEMLAEDCKKFLDSQAVSNPIIICGLSMGGYVTFALYRSFPQLFRGMILSSTRAAADSPGGKANRELAIQNVKTHGVPFIVDGMLPKTVSPKTPASNPALMSSLRDIMLETSVAGIIGASQGMHDRPDSTELLSQIKVPVLVIHGADDQIIPVSEAQAMHEKIPGSRLVIIPDAGHMVNMEQPELFNNAVREFIQSLG